MTETQYEEPEHNNDVADVHKELQYNYTQADNKPISLSLSLSLFSFITSHLFHSGCFIFWILSSE